ncbi:MAG: HNH endonuclease, partial [Acidobacteriia bacterium]|nr:HNH endonuclease [Terriglobia bacterium]
MGCWPLLPDRYAPLQANGNGIQSIYLIEVSETFAQVLAGIIGADAQGLIAAVPVGAPMQMNDDLDYWEHKIESGIAGDTTVTETEREAI